MIIQAIMRATDERGKSEKVVIWLRSGCDFAGGMHGSIQKLSPRFAGIAASACFYFTFNFLVIQSVIRTYL